ncbi:MAG: orotidine-5'-phosphate decarboxylase [Pseudomonadota bacterium]
MNTANLKNRIYCALDTADLSQAREWAASISPVTGALKLGMEFVNSFGPQGIEAIKKAAPDADLFIDLKFHDIPNTVAGAVRTICNHFAPAYLNVHAAGGFAMMEAAKDACTPQTKLLAVTILTSLDQDAIAEVGYQNDLSAQVKTMAQLTQKAGLDGVVCSALEIALIREACRESFDLMVPGIRPKGAAQGDQKRVMSPAEALSAGATHLVIGRPITGTDDPAQAAADILETL